jgi:Family of unknown function (DUF6188)
MEGMFRRRSDGGFDLAELVGNPVTAIRLIGLVEVHMGEGFKLQIERDFTVRAPGDAEGTSVEFRPYDAGWSPKGMNELVSLFGAVVAAADASPDATLRVRFDDGSSIEVLPDPKYEGWNLWTPDGGVLGQPAGVGFV